jgi:hypothetical protein
LFYRFLLSGGRLKTLASILGGFRQCKGCVFEDFTSYSIEIAEEQAEIRVCQEK